MKEVCVIGGSRYFGRRLVRLLRDSGIRVTLVNRGSAGPPPGVRHVVADRDDERSLATALGGRDFDVVLDQVCGTPSQAAVARRVFAGHTGRYVMTSTIEVYDGVSTPGIPLTEDAVQAAGWPVRPELPWSAADFLEQHYGEGKRQAEAVFAREPEFPFVAVRSGHVVGGADFTGRLDHYLRRIRAGEPVLVRPENHPSSFIYHEEIADFLYWAAEAEFVGPVNACSHGELSVINLSEQIAAAVGTQPYFEVAAPGSAASPYAFDRYYGIDNFLAEKLGFTFSTTADWLPQVIAEGL